MFCAALLLACGGPGGETRADDPGASEQELGNRPPPSPPASAPANGSAKGSADGAKASANGAKTANRACLSLATFRDGAWFIEGGATHSFGMADDIPISGDWNGDGRAKLGVFRSLPDGHAVFSLDTDGDGMWNPRKDAAPYFGLAGDVPVSGDWNGNGRSKVGVFRSLPDGHGVFSLDMDGDGAWNPSVDKVVYFGLAGDRPVVGDWNGDGRTKLGVFRSLADGHGQFSLDMDGDGVWNPQKDDAPYFGLAGDIPVSGDWNGDGRSKIGVVRSAGTLLEWSLDSDGSHWWDSARDVAVTFGRSNELPTVLAK